MFTFYIRPDFKQIVCEMFSKCCRSADHLFLTACVCLRWPWHSVWNLFYRLHLFILVVSVHFVTASERRTALLFYSCVCMFAGIDRSETWRTDTFLTVCYCNLTLTVCQQHHSKTETVSWFFLLKYNKESSYEFSLWAFSQAYENEEKLLIVFPQICHCCVNETIICLVFFYLMKRVLIDTIF